MTENSSTEAVDSIVAHFSTTKLLAFHVPLFCGVGAVTWMMLSGRFHTDELIHAKDSILLLVVWACSAALIAQIAPIFGNISGKGGSALFVCGGDLIYICPSKYSTPLSGVRRARIKGFKLALDSEEGSISIPLIYLKEPSTLILERLCAILGPEKIGDSSDEGVERPPIT